VANVFESFMFDLLLDPVHSFFADAYAPSDLRHIIRFSIHTFNLSCSDYTIIIKSGYDSVRCVNKTMKIEIRFIAENDKDMETLKLLDNTIKTAKVEIKLGAD